MSGGNVIITGGAGGINANGGNVELVGVTIKAGDAYAEISKPESSKPSFWEHELTKWVLSIVGAIIVAAITWYLGWG